MHQTGHILDNEMVPTSSVAAEPKNDDRDFTTFLNMISACDMWQVPAGLSGLFRCGTVCTLA
jgi:hypothetical protein